MRGLFLLYILSFVPVTGKDTIAITKARDAALIQVGSKEEWDTITHAIDRETPPVIKQAGSVYGIVHNKAFQTRIKKFDFQASEQKALLTFTITF